MHAEFSAALRRAMTATRTTRPMLYHGIGADTNSVKGWMLGRTVPMHATVVAIAEFLGRPELVEISERHRTGECVSCGNRTINLGRGSTPARYCSARCVQRITDRRIRERKREQRVQMLVRSESRYRAAVEAFCHGCEPADRLCRDSGCSLRPVSPFPFVPLRELRRTA